MGFFTELRRRQVPKVAVAYLVLAWLLIQVTDTVAPALQLPAWTLSFVVWVCILGFLPALLFSWAFQFTADGVRRDDGDAATPSDPGVAQRLNIIIAALAVAVTAVVSWNYFGGESAGPQTPVEPVSDPAVAGRDGYRSIAVLPFVNLSDDPQQEYLSDGLAEELLNLLAQLDALKVAARTSSFAFKGRNTDIRDIGQSLAVETVLEGSVRKSGDRIRVTAQLIDAANGYHLWSDTYDRTLSDVFAIQDEVSAAIVGALQVHLSGDVPAAPVVDVEAWEIYLRGREAAGDGDPRRALELYRDATERDPEFAAAWAARAEMVLALRETDYWGEIPREEAFALARANIERALDINPRSADALAMRGRLQWEQYRYDEALASVEQALAVNPNLASAHMERALLLEAAGNISGGFDARLRALELDPLDPAPLFNTLTFISQAPRADFVEAFLKHLRSQRELPPPLQPDAVAATIAALTARDPLPHLQAAFAHLPPPVLSLWYLRNFAEMRSDWIQFTKYPREIELEFRLDEGNFDEARAIFEELPQERRDTAVGAERLSLIRLGLGDCEGSLAALRRAHGDNVPIYTQVAPAYPRSNPNLAANRALCLQRAGRDTEVRAITARFEAYVRRVRESYAPIALLEAKLAFLTADADTAIGALEAGWQAGSLSWPQLNDPFLVEALPADHPRLTALRADVWSTVNRNRAGLGWPPTDWRYGLDSGPLPDVADPAGP